MKKTVLILLAIVTFVMIVPTAAKEGSVSDANVDYIYWDQNEITTYWTGVTNKTNANDYQPCVGAVGGGAECGKIAYQYEYKEFGLKINVPHAHFLRSKYNTNDYQVE